MIKDIFLSFRDNFKEKTANPFLGTYILIWLLRNWELIYSLFNFDSKSKLIEKVTFIKEYYSLNPFMKGVLLNILWTFGVLVFTYFLLNISRAIVNLFEKQLKPWVYKITDYKSTVLKSTYELVRNDRDDLQKRLDNERDSKSRLEIRIKSLEEEILERERAIAERQGEESIIERESEIEQIQKKLDEEGILAEFRIIAINIKKGKSISSSYKSIDRFIELGLIKYKRAGYQSSVYYDLTTEGNELMKYIGRL